MPDLEPDRSRLLSNISLDPVNRFVPVQRVVFLSSWERVSPQQVARQIWRGQGGVPQQLIDGISAIPRVDIMVPPGISAPFDAGSAEEKLFWYTTVALPKIIAEPKKTTAPALPLASAGGLEEMKVWSLERLAEVDPGFANELRIRQKIAVALLPEKALEEPTWVRNLNAVLFAHPKVLDKVSSIVRQDRNFEGGTIITRELSEDPTRANAQLQEAQEEALRDGTVLFVGVDKSQKEGLILPVKALTLLIDPATMDQIAPLDILIVATFLQQPNREILAGYVLDLAAGTVRRVTIDGTAYYALDIGA